MLEVQPLSLLQRTLDSKLHIASTRNQVLCSMPRPMSTKSTHSVSQGLPCQVQFHQLTGTKRLQEHQNSTKSTPTLPTNTVLEPTIPHKQPRQPGPSPRQEVEWTCTVRHPRDSLSSLTGATTRTGSSQPMSGPNHACSSPSFLKCRRKAS